MISATLDTSVYVRALHFGGPATVIIGHARAGNIRVDISDAIVAETIRVLRDKFQWDGYSLQDARGKLLALGNRVSPTETVRAIKEDPDDDRILECAAAQTRTLSSAKTRTCSVYGNSEMHGSCRSGISSIWRSRSGVDQRLREQPRRPLPTSSLLRGR